MPSTHDKKHHQKPTHHKKQDCGERVHDISIFNNVNVNAPVQQSTASTAEKKEDGCSGCFKSLFSAMKR